MEKYPRETAMPAIQCQSHLHADREEAQHISKITGVANQDFLCASHEDTEVIDRGATGVSAATKTRFEETLAAHAGMLSRIAASYEAQPAAREDLLQDTAVALWHALPMWRGEGSLRSFVARIAHNRCVNHVVAQRRHRHEDLTDEDFADRRADPQRHATDAQRCESLQRALRRLPLGQRQAVTLALEGFSHAEIADALGIKVNNADARISRARRTLTQYLGEQA